MSTSVAPEGVDVSPVQKIERVAQTSRLRKYTLSSDEVQHGNYGWNTDAGMLGEATSLGVYLFLRFQRQAIILLLLLAALKVWPWYQNASGSRCDTSTNGISSAENSLDCGDSFLIKWSLENCSDYHDSNIFFGSGQLSHQLLEISIWLFALWYGGKLLEKECISYDRAHNSPQDYALFVRGLPDDTTREQILEHIEKSVMPASHTFEKAEGYCWNAFGDYIEANCICCQNSAEQWMQIATVQSSQEGATPEAERDKADLDEERKPSVPDLSKTPRRLPPISPEGMKEEPVGSSAGECASPRSVLTRRPEEGAVAECHMLVSLDSMMNKYRQWEQLAIQIAWPDTCVIPPDQEVEAWLQQLRDEQAVLMEEIQKAEQELENAGQLSASNEAIIVFHSSEDAHRVLTLHNKATKETAAPLFRGMKLEMHRAPGPNEIRWEHQQVDPNERLCSLIKGLAVMFLCVAVGAQVVWVWEYYMDFDLDATQGALITIGSAYISGIVNRLNKWIAVVFSEKQKPRTSDYLVTAMMYKMSMSYIGVFMLTYILLKGLTADSWYSDDGLVMSGIMIMCTNPLAYSSILTFQTVFRSRQCLVLALNKHPSEAQLAGVLSPPDFNLGEAYAKVLHTLGLAMVFAPAWPPAYLLSAMSLSLILFAHRIALTKHLHKPVPLDGRAAFGAFKMLYLYALMHIIMAYVFIDRYQYYSQIPDSDRGHADGERGEEKAAETALPLLLVSLSLWLLAISMTKRTFRFDNTSGVWSSHQIPFPSTLEAKAAVDVKARRISSWDYERPSQHTLVRRMRAYIQMCEANGLRGCRDGTLYLPDYVRALDASGSPVTLA